ncbi:MAG: recombinase RecA [Thermoprotei archaeon]|nr:MAG: recombinase RecA [Thermoprotei archaeon]
MKKRSCKDCIYFMPGSNLCIKYGIRVTDVDKPPCEKMTVTNNSAVLREEHIAELIEAEASRVQKESKRRRRTRYVTQLEEPPIKYGQVSTGIDGLDKILGGGFIKGRTYLVAGETGTGKTIFSLQFLLAGARNDEPGVYISIDEPAHQVIQGVKNLGWDMEPFIKRRLLQFLDMKEQFTRMYLKGARSKMEPKDVANSILDHVEKIDATRLVIDPIAPLMYAPVDVLWAREYLRELIFTLESKRTITTVMTSEIPSGSSSLSRFGVEEFLAAGIIVLGIMEYQGRIVRIMYIRKMRWLPVQPSKYIFRIVPNRGIVLEGPLDLLYSEE